MYEEPPVANAVTIDALGNTNQVSLSQLLNECLSCAVIVWTLSSPRTFLSGYVKSGHTTTGNIIFRKNVFSLLKINA